MTIVVRQAPGLIEQITVLDRGRGTELQAHYNQLDKLYAGTLGSHGKQPITVMCSGRRQDVAVTMSPSEAVRLGEALALLGRQHGGGSGA